MSARPVDRCGVCGSTDLESVLHLGSSPPTCVMQPVGTQAATEEHHPLELLRCGECTLVQLSVAVDAKTMFPAEYPYQSGNSPALHRNFEDLAREASEYLDPHDLVVDIGANDGTLLSKFDGCRKIGVEPTKQADKIPVSLRWQEPFTADTARDILAVCGQAKVITACNVLAHVDDIDDVMRGIDILLADDGVLIAENHDLASVVDGGQWDTVYHEHLRFFDPYSFHALLAKHGLTGESWQPIATHGGSFRTLATKRLSWFGGPDQRDYDFEGLAQAATQARRAIRAETKEPLWGIGATARATTIINYCGLDVEDIECVCEVAGSDKVGHYIPGTSIEVVDEGRLFEEQPERVVLFSWHLADIIVPKLRERGFRGDIVTPLPTLTVRRGMAGRVPAGHG